jgi:soluble lytic murein transglycosylase-like protein
MPRARIQNEDWQTAAAEYEEGSGCLSGFAIVPLAVIIISLLLASFAWQAAPLPVKAQPPAPTFILEATPDSTSPSLSPIFRREVLHWGDSIVKWASASNLDPNLVATVMQIESCGDPRAMSSAGAMGLFQVMPYHFLKSDNPYTPDTNAARGLDYLARSLKAANGDARLAMAGYNGGIGIIPRGEWTWSAQTKRYVQYGAPIYADATNGADVSNSLNEWYTKYGVSLCKQASKRLGLP